MPTIDELHAADEAMRAEIVKLHDGHARHEIALQETSTWRKDVDRTIDEIKRLQNHVAIELQGLRQDLDTTPTKAVGWFLGGFALIAIISIIALAIR